MSSSVESRQYLSISLSESLCITGAKHASHCMLYSIHKSEDISYALLQLRFDGLIGFAGGEVDVEDVEVKHIIDATNRELEEEISYGLESVAENDWICSHRDFGSKFVQHFFAKQLSFEELCHLETTHTSAQHFPSESLGLFRVPIGGSDPKSSQICRKFLNNFLRQKFAGNAKQQFIQTIKKRSLLSIEDQNWIQSNDFFDNNSVNNGIEVKALFRAELPVHYHEETVDVVYALMVIRDNGLFDFIGTVSSDSMDKNSIIQTLIKSLKNDLSSNGLPIDSESHVLAFDDGLSHVFDVHLKSNQFIEIETNFTKCQNFNDKSLGIFRIPLQMKGNTEKSDKYVNRFFNGFLNQRFVNNSKMHLKSILDQNCNQI